MSAAPAVTLAVPGMSACWRGTQLSLYLEGKILCGQAFSTNKQASPLSRVPSSQERALDAGVVDQGLERFVGFPGCGDVRLIWLNCTIQACSKGLQL